MSNLPTGYSAGYPYTSWGVGELCSLIQAVITSSSSNAFNGTVGATTPSTGVFTTLKSTGALSVSNQTTTITSGAGAPSGTVPNGSLYLRTDGSTNTRLYVSEGGGTWAAISSA